MLENKRISWPQGKQFAFTIFDDTDYATVENVKPVYDFLADIGMFSTKSVWPLKGGQVPKVGGSTCEDDRYRQWTLELQRQGFEIGFHNATYHTSSREDTIRGIERFRDIYGNYPGTMANHTGCYEGIYWGSTRLTGINRLAYNLLTRYSRHNKFRGHVEDDDLFWGDVCQNKIKYLRNFVFADINTLKCCPMMPYHDPGKPYVNYWFASSDGATVDSFNKCISESRQDQLEEENGACIMYTHLACGFYQHGKLNSRFRELLERLSRKNGWFVPADVLLDFLLERNGGHRLTSPERRRLERRWLWDKLRIGHS